MTLIYIQMNSSEELLAMVKEADKRKDGNIDYKCKFLQMQSILKLFYFVIIKKKN